MPLFFSKIAICEPSLLLFLGPKCSWQKSVAAPNIPPSLVSSNCERKTYSNCQVKKNKNRDLLQKRCNLKKNHILVSVDLLLRALLYPLELATFIHWFRRSSLFIQRHIYPVWKFYDRVPYLGDMTSPWNRLYCTFPSLMTTQAHRLPLFIHLLCYIHV